MSLIFYKFLKFYFLSFVFVVAGVTLVKFVVGGLSTVLLCGGQCKSCMFYLSQGLQGEIRHLYRSFAFLHSRMMTENGGIFVSKTRQLQLAGGARVSLRHF